MNARYVPATRVLPTFTGVADRAAISDSIDHPLSSHDSCFHPD
jgi:hypothetical protein